MKYVLTALAVIASASLLWAWRADPFRRVEFRLKAAPGLEAKGIAVLPKPQARFPVIIYPHDSGASVVDMGRELRRFAELGVAAIGLEYDLRNQAAFEEQMIALSRYLKDQPWALTNATAWVGVGLGAERALNLAFLRPELQPKLIVAIEPEIRNPKPETRKKAEIRNPNSASGDVSTRPAQVLLVHRDSKECETLAEQLRGAGMPVTLRVLPQLGHGLGEERGAVMRAVAEYCAEQLPLADYCSSQKAEGRGQRAERGSLSAEEASRFNLAMRRAGQHRRELWRAVTAFAEPERHTVMTVIGGLEDYDLAHITARQLREEVKSAWRARRTYPWCRDAPLDVFERFVANRRIYEEPLPAWQPAFLRHSLPRVKYARDTAEASDAVEAWVYSRLPFRTRAHGPESSLPEMLDEQESCREGAMIYTYLGRLLGLPMRPAYTIWPTLASWHWFSEVWSTEENQWHAVDSANQDRTYRSSWVLRVPKSSVLSTTGERGGWNALKERRWEAFTNTIGLFYPSGQVAVRVLDREQPAKDQRVMAQIWLNEEVLSVAAARTDANGEAQLTLGQSAVQPYRLSIDKPGDPDWQWLAVGSNQTCTVTLRLDQSKPFDRSRPPPPLDFADWKGNSPP